MPTKRIEQLSGISGIKGIGHGVDHDPKRSQCCGMSEEDTRKFLREEQAEGTHPSLRGKHF